MSRRFMTLASRQTASVLLIFFSACHSFRPVTYPQYVIGSIDAGNDVRVTRRSGERLILGGAHFEGDTLKGSDQEAGDFPRAIPVSDIANVEISRIDDGKTIWLAVALSLVALVGAAYFLLITFGVTG